jgi:hypothetical protein
MAQTFSPIANLIAKSSLALLLVLVIGLLGAWYGLERSSYVTRENIPREQPVQFSHRHHVEGLGIDCRYCHLSVEDSSFAGIPATSICMNCHEQIWNQSPMLAPVRESYENKQPLQWTRVHDLPDFAYFNHAAHVQKGVGCTTCHGQLDQTALAFKDETLFMQWCLNCHREPERYLRPRDEVFNMDYEPPENQLELGRELVERYNVRPPQQMTDCITCHR